MKNTAQRKNETHQGFKNLDTFKFALNIDNNSTHYEELQRIFESNFNNWNASVVKEEVKNFLKSKKEYVKQNEGDFFISNVDFDALTHYYINDYINEYLKYKIEGVKFNVFFKRYFDKINGNSYFIFKISFNNGVNLNSENLYYGYGNLIQDAYVQEFFEKYHINKSLIQKEFDLGCFPTQKILKQFIGLI